MQTVESRAPNDAADAPTNGLPAHYGLEGWFAIPHWLFGAAPAPLTRSEKLYLATLLHFENRYTARAGPRWFYVTDERLTKASGLSRKTIGKVRRTLKAKGLIDCRIGQSHRATEYAILFDHHRLKSESRFLCKREP